MAKKKLSTQDILAAARGQDTEGTGKESVEDQGGGETPVSQSADSQTEKPAAPATSTADILAAARAESAGDAGATADQESGTQSAAKPPSGGKASSTADILAAARAESTAGGEAAATKPAASSKAPTSKAPTSKAPAKKPSAASGEKPSVQEMLKAVREGHQQDAAAQKPGKPKLPASPPKLPRKKGPASSKTRRNVLVALVATPFALAWTTLTVTTGASLLGLARFMFPNVLVEPPMRFKIGPPIDYPLNTVSTKWKGARGIWVVHTDTYEGENLMYALFSTCTHLGCTPNWLEGEVKFKCPCHGSGFYMNGINFEGPAPRPLERCGIRVAEDGMLEVDKSVKFQEELGQWEDPSSFIDGSLV